MLFVNLKGPDIDTTPNILQDHAEQRRVFAAIGEIDPNDTESLTAVWGFA
jgi:hypothetical protein